MLIWHNAGQTDLTLFSIWSIPVAIVPKGPFLDIFKDLACLPLMHIFDGLGGEVYI